MSWWSRGSGGRREGRRSEIHGEPLAPDRYCAVLAEVETGGHVVILVSVRPLELAEFDVARLLDGGVVTRIRSGHEVNPDVRSVGGGELGETEDPRPVGQPEYSGRAPGLVGDGVEPSARQLLVR